MSSFKLYQQVAPRLICIYDQAEIIIRPVSSELKLPICVFLFDGETARFARSPQPQRAQSAFRSPMSEDRTVQILRQCGQTSRRTLLKCETQKCNQHHTTYNNIQ